MSTTHTPSPPHQANIDAKAWRAVEAIKIIADTVLVPGADWPEITDRTAAMAYLAETLFDGSPEGDAWWTAIGILHDAAMGRTTYGVGPGARIEQPTQFNTSRPVIADLLAGSVWAAEQVPADPFAGLDGGPF